MSNLIVNNEYSFKLEYLPCASSCLRCMGHDNDDCVLIINYIYKRHYVTQMLILL